MYDWLVVDERYDRLYDELEQRRTRVRKLSICRSVQSYLLELLIEVEVRVT